MIFHAYVSTVAGFFTVVHPSDREIPEITWVAVTDGTAINARQLPFFRPGHRGMRDVFFHSHRIVGRVNSVPAVHTADGDPAATRT